MTSSLSPYRIPPPIRDGLGVGVAVGISGLAFGSAAVTAGLSVAQACVLSLVAFTGASQFALIGVISGGGNVVAGAVGALLLGGRNTLYGLRMADVLGWTGRRRAAAAQGVIDETTAVTLAQPDPRSARLGFISTFAAIYVMWNSTTLIGALATGSIGDPNVFGLDAVGPAVFLALLWPRFTAAGSGEGARQRRRTVAVALLGAVIALALTPVLPPGVPVMIAAVAALVGMDTTGSRGATGPEAPAGSGGAAVPGADPGAAVGREDAK